MQTIEQPDGRYQKRNDQEEKNDAAFAALFPKRPATFSRSSVAVAFVVQRHRNVKATAALARAREQFFALTSLHLFSDSRRVFFFSRRRRHTRCLSDWSSDVCSSD